MQELRLYVRMPIFIEFCTGITIISGFFQNTCPNGILVHIGKFRFTHFTTEKDYIIKLAIPYFVMLRSVFVPDFE